MDNVVLAFGGSHRALRAYLELNEFINRFKAVKRGVEFAGSDGKERNAEHTFQVVFIAWALNTSEKLGFDPYWLMLVAMFHDFVEYLHGDTPMFPDEFRGEPPPDPALKRQKEEEAYDELRRRFDTIYPEMVRAMRAYLDQSDEVSIFVSALGKLVVVTNIFQDHGRSWRIRGISIDTAYKRHVEGASKHPVVLRLFEQVWEMIREDAARNPNLYAPDLPASAEDNNEKRRSE